jgi:hypothetical protein
LFPVFSCAVGWRYDPPDFQQMGRAGALHGSAYRFGAVWVVAWRGVVSMTAAGRFAATNSVYGKMGKLNPRQVRARSRAMARIEQPTMMELIDHKREVAITAYWFEARQLGYLPADVALAIAWIGCPA